MFSAKQLALVVVSVVAILCSFSVFVEMMNNSPVSDLFWVQWLELPISKLKVWHLLLILWFFAIISRDEKV